MTAQGLIDLWKVGQERGHYGELNEDDTVSFAGKAGQTFTKPIVAEARRAIRGCNNISALTIGKSIMSWSNVPSGLSPKLFEEIAARRDNPAYLASHDRRTIGKGSGIGSDARAGEDCCFDNQGKHAASTFGATFIGAFMCAVCGWGMGFGFLSPKTLAVGLGKYIAKMKSHGITVKRAFCDCAAEVGEQFTTTAEDQAGRELFAAKALEVALSRSTTKAAFQQQQNLMAWRL
jgi:hypothetical protein